ncbi:unnamed protein product [Lepeophtheirus salmonis]|uniref:(salmon louse) hypothetical protein n=1 Tax=Lepeophtheirus salmonis TaxID=72036 RepID=A0A7R8CQN1_LEPSM|nr:unnamed protein product [Lepeophtheirus salmonis]CAF2894763.1 unnamed protein product [Lepeophtheirus salmonis]
MGQCSLTSNRKRRSCSSPISSSIEVESSPEEESEEDFNNNQDILYEMASEQFMIRDIQKKGECETFVIDFVDDSSRKKRKPPPLPLKTKRNSFRKVSGLIKRKSSASSVRELRNSTTGKIKISNKKDSQGRIEIRLWERQQLPFEGRIIAFRTVLRKTLLNKKKHNIKSSRGGGTVTSPDNQSSKVQGKKERYREI